MRDPQGRTWKVRRRWLPWKPRSRKPWRDPGDWSFSDIGDLDFVDGPFSFFVVILIAIAAGLVLAFLLPFLITALELIIVLVLLPAFLIARLAFRTPWIVIAETRDEPAERHSRAVSGWRASGDAIGELETQISLGTLSQQT